MNYIISFLLLTTISIYDLDDRTVSGSTIHLSDYRQKKLLLVNVATGSNYKSQLQELELLQQSYHDSLQVIVFPSNSFGHEAKDSAALADYFSDSVQVSYPVVLPSPVTGQDMHPVYAYLSGSAGLSGLSIQSDFQKVLINKEGRITGVFAGKVSPLDPLVEKAIIR